MTAVWVGLDCGTGGARALAVDASGRVLRGHTEPHAEMRMPQPQWAEQDPADWWRAACLALRAVAAPEFEIRALGLSGQMHGLTLLDESGAVIRPALLWCDQRSQAQVDALEVRMGREAIVRATANPMLTGFTLPKLLWVRDREPELLARVRRVLLPKDYLRWKLTGEAATDVADASGTGLFDVAARAWSPAMLAGAGVPAAWLPRAYESREVTGRVTAAAARETGLPAGLPVVAGAGDQAASAIGNGIVAPGAVSCTLGTSGVVFAHLAEPAYDPAGRVHTFAHAVRGAWHAMGVTQGAGLSLQWFRNRLAPGADYEALTAEAARAQPGSGGLFWLPYLMGERTPVLDAAARGGWIGLTASHTRADLIRSLLEGVAFSQKDSLDVLTALGAAAERVRLSGGGARSPFWRQMFADVFGKPVATLATEEGSAYGAALLALVGTGEFASEAEVCAAVVREREIVAPDPERAARYAAAHRRYRDLYPRLQSWFER
jgi:xylulokinase